LGDGDQPQRCDQRLPGVRRPMAASFTGPEINEPMTFEM
jgi:hypothetical protein